MQFFYLRREKMPSYYDLLTVKKKTQINIFSIHKYIQKKTWTAVAVH